MKSQQLEINTKCETCSFAITENNKQVGCAANRLQKFTEQGKVKDGENGYFTISRFCNMHRRTNISVDVAYDSIKSKFGIAIFGFDESEDYINTAIESCKKIEYDKHKFRISLYSNKKEHFGRLFNEVNEFKKLGIEARLFFNVVERSIIDSETDVFQYLRGCSHLVKMRSDQSIDPLFLHNINKSLNDDLEVAFTYESNNVYCLPFWIVNQQYLNYNNYDLMTSNIIQESIESSMHKTYAE